MKNLKLRNEKLKFKFSKNKLKNLEQKFPEKI